MGEIGSSEVERILYPLFYFKNKIRNLLSYGCSRKIKSNKTINYK